MRWDSSRPVPWTRLVREWIVYVAVMVVVMLLAFRDQFTVGLLAGLLVSGPVYLVIGATLAKFGYQRTTLRDLRSQRTAETASAAPARGRPAPTRRTGGAPQRRGSKRR